MKVSFRICGDQRDRDGTLYPHQLLGEHWKSSIGKTTADGDLITDVFEYSDDEFHVYLEVVNEKNLQWLGCRHKCENLQTMEKRI